MEILGWSGSIILAISSFPQMVKTVRDGHADGLSWFFVSLWLIGEALSLGYVVLNLNWPLIANYGANLAIVMVIGFYKMFPRSSRIDNTLTPNEINNIMRQIR